MVRAVAKKTGTAVEVPPRRDFSNGKPSFMTADGQAMGINWVS